MHEKAFGDGREAYSALQTPIAGFKRPLRGREGQNGGREWTKEEERGKITPDHKFLGAVKLFIAAGKQSVLR